jgi:hypothetical protein
MATTQKSFEEFVQRALTDANFRKQLHDNPAKVLEEYAVGDREEAAKLIGYGSYESLERLAEAFSRANKIFCV